MNPESTQRQKYEVVEEVSKWTVGLGVLTFALFPLALPILALTAIAVLPLLIPAVALGLLMGLVALPVRLFRRRLRRRPRRSPLQVGTTRTPRSAS
jgi:membrane protein implicated in regulation of membrane protease activity